MNSFDDQELVYLYMDGELSDAEYEAFEARLRQETKLQGLLAEARAIQVETRSLLDAPAPLGLKTRVMAEIHAGDVEASEGLLERFLTGLRLRWPVPVAVAACLALVFGLGLGGGAEETQNMLSPTPALEPSQVTSPQPRMAAGAVEIEDLDAGDDYDIMIYVAPGSNNQMIWLTPKKPEEEG
jgi:anti-sigma factor RsiW